MSNSFWSLGLQHARLPCSSPSPGVCSNSCPLSQCHPTISSSVVPFSSCPESFPASGSFPMSWLFSSGGQSIGASASVLPMNIQDWVPVRLTGLISLHFKGLSRVFSEGSLKKREVSKHQETLSLPNLCRALEGPDCQFGQYCHKRIYLEYNGNFVSQQELCKEADGWRGTVVGS